MNLKTLLGQLRLLAILEGISYISFAITMPLKYMYDIKGPNKIIGMIHGGLFIAYVIWVIINHSERKWQWKKTGLLLLASIVPFMTFWAEKKLLKED